jgi:hypothetical protein
VITGALILAAGIVLGWLLRSLPARRKEPEPVKAVCGCTHHHSMHDPQTGACHAAVEVSRYNQHGGWTGKEYKACACRRYSGPEPLPEYYAPEIAGEAGQ